MRNIFRVSPSKENCATRKESLRYTVAPLRWAKWPADRDLVIGFFGCSSWARDASFLCHLQRTVHIPHISYRAPCCTYAAQPSTDAVSFLLSLQTTHTNSTVQLRLLSAALVFWYSIIRPYVYAMLLYYSLCIIINMFIKLHMSYDYKSFILSFVLGSDASVASSDSFSHDFHIWNWNKHSAL